MKISINTSSQFMDKFKQHDRDNFSYKGYQVLFNYLENIDSDYELDVIAICCEYTESSIDDALKDCGLDSLDELKDNTTVLEVDDETIIYANY